MLGQAAVAPQGTAHTGNSQITLFPLLLSSVFPGCCSALKVCLVLDVPLPHWGNYCCFPPHQEFTDHPPFQISRSWYKPVHFQRLFNRCWTHRRCLKEYSSAKLELYNKRNWDLLNCNSCFLPTESQCWLTACLFMYTFSFGFTSFSVCCFCCCVCSLLSPYSKCTHKNPVLLLLY